MKKLAVFIAGPITGVPEYWKAFAVAEDELYRAGHIALNPSRLPGGMELAQYERICMAMIDSADAVLFLPGWSKSRGANLEMNFCRYVGKPFVFRVSDLEEVRACGT